MTPSPAGWRCRLPASLAVARRLARVRDLLHESFDGLIAVAEREIARAARQLERLDTQERKLLERDYAGRVSEGVYEREFGRIQRERGAAEQTLTELGGSYDDARRTLDQALDLTRDVQVAYDEANSTERRFFNQAFFERLEILEDDVAAATLAQPFRLLLDEELVESVATWTEDHRTDPDEAQDRAVPALVGTRDDPNPRPFLGRGFD